MRRLVSLIVVVVLSIAVVSFSLNIPIDYKVYSGQYPHYTMYDTIGYYSVDPRHGLVVLAVHPQVLLPTNYGSVVLIDVFNGYRDSASYLDLEPVQAYFYRQYIVVTGLHHVSDINSYNYKDGMGIYIVNRDLEVVAKKIMYEKYVTLYYPYTKIIELDQNSFILPVPRIVINYTRYIRLYKAIIGPDDSLDLEVLFSYHTAYYPYLSPIIYGDYIFWGGLIISRDTHEILKDYVFHANSSYISFISNGMYYFTNYYSYPTYRALEVIGVNTTTLRIVYRRTVYNVSSANPIDIMRAYLIGDRYIVYIASLTPSSLRYLLANKIGVGVFDVLTNRSYFAYKTTANGFLIGRYMDKIILFVNTTRIIVVYPEISTALNQTISGLGLNYRSPGDLVLLYNPITKQYYLLLLPITYNKYYLVVFNENELKPLPEPNNTLLLLFSIILCITLQSRILLRKH